MTENRTGRILRGICPKSQEFSKFRRALPLEESPQGHRSKACAGVAGGMLLFGVLTFVEGAVGDALEQARVIVEVADMPPMQRVGVAVELRVAERL